MKIRPLLQLTRTECGLCCLAMICQFYGKRQPMVYYRKTLKGGRDGANVKDIVIALNELGIVTQIKKVDLAELDKIQTPILTILDRNHFVVIEKKKGSKIVINDPAIGKILLTEEELKKRIGQVWIQTEKSERFQAENKSMMEWLPFFKVLLMEKKLVVFSAIYSLIQYVCVMLIPILIQTYIDSLTVSQGAGAKNLMIKYGIALVLFYVIISWIKNRTAVKLESCIDKNFLHAVIDKLIHLPYSFFELRTSGDLLFRLNLLNSVRTLVSDIIIGVLDIVGVVFALCYATYLSPQLVGVSVLVFAMICLITIYLNSKIVCLNHNELAELTNITMAESELVNSIQDVKSMHVENSFAKKIKDSHERFSREFQHRNRWSKLNASVLQFFQLFLPVFLLFLILLGQETLQMTFGQIIAYYSVSTILVMNSISFMQRWTNVNLMKNSLARINEILLEEEAPRGERRISDFNELSVKNVTFSYSNSSDKSMVLRDVSFKVKKGERIAIVGKSGSGKSTLVKLLTGLYQTNCGEISYNSVPVAELSEESYADLIGVVTQNAVVFNKSIKENILLNREQVSREELYAVMKRVGILDEVLAMPMREETLISELGANLSGGQRQRLAMARVLISRPQLIILDEATSSLDGMNEQEITGYLRDLHCTQIIISHRLSTIKDVDRVYVLKDGEIIEQGELNELTDSDSYFHMMFAAQLNHPA